MFQTLKLKHTVKPVLTTTSEHNGQSEAVTTSLNEAVLPLIFFSA
jgi:hypothetical protein